MTKGPSLALPRKGDRGNKLPLYDALRMYNLITATHVGKGKAKVSCWHHEDKNPSMSIDFDKGVYHCFSCGAEGDTVTLLKERGMSEIEAMRTAYGPTGKGTKELSGDLPLHEKKYEYKDKNGHVMFVVLRKPKLSPNSKLYGSKYLPFMNDGNGWKSKMSIKSNKPLYNLPEILSRKDDLVFIVEGEHCAETLKEALRGRHVITTWQGGCKAWRKTDWTPLQGRQFAFISDADEAGRLAAKQISNTLVRAHGCTGKTWLIDGDDGHDCVDLIREMGRAEFIKLAHKKLIDYVPEDDLADDEGQVSENKIESLTDNTYFKLIGYAGDHMFFRDRISDELIQIRRRNISTGDLISLAPMEFWAGENNLSSNRVNRVSSALNEAIKKKPPLNMEKFFGRGAIDTKEDGYLFHLGDRVMNADGKRYRLSENKFKNIYRVMPTLPYKRTTNNWNARMEEFREILERCSWRTVNDGKLAMGWLASCLAGGALEWRPTLWVVGAPESGKTTILDYFHLVMGREYAQKFDNVTEAGLAEAASSDALPIFIDEAEPSRLPDGFDSFIRVTASSSSGGRTRAKRDGGVRIIRPRASIMCGSIVVPKYDTATMQRVLIAELYKPKLPEEQMVDYERKMRRLVKDLRHFVKDYGHYVRDGMIERIPHILERADTHIDHLIDAGVGNRQAALLAGPCAGLELFYGEDSEEMGAFYTDMAKMRGKRDESATDSAREVLLSILTHTVDNSNTYGTSAISAAASSNRGRQGRAAALGIKYIEKDHELLMDHNCPAITEILKKTGYQMFSLKNLAALIPGIYMNTDRSTRFNFRVVKSFLRITATALNDLGYNKEDMRELGKSSDIKVVEVAPNVYSTDRPAPNPNKD